jgi:hypothetical protein
LLGVAERPHGWGAQRSSAGGIAAHDDAAAVDHSSVDDATVNLAIRFSSEPVGRKHQVAAQAG